MKLLLIDDNDSIHAAFVATLSPEDTLISVVNQSDGMAAYQTDKTIDCIIFDTTESPQSTRDMFAAIRYNDPSVGIVIYSGRAHDVARILPLGVNAVFDKSTSVVEVVHAARRASLLSRQNADMTFAESVLDGFIEAGEQFLSFGRVR